MAFEGIYPAPELTVAPCGLLSVADVWTHTRSKYDERWVRGFSYEFESRPTVRLLTVYDDTITNGELFDGADLAIFEENVPFFIETESDRSAMSLQGEDRYKSVLRQLDAATQKAVERELENGYAAQAVATPNHYLVEAATTTILGGGAVTPDKGLHLLEQSISSSPTGAQGIIHMTRDVASELGSKLLYKVIDGEEAVITRLGTRVVVGSGYLGSGPIGDGGAAPSATNKWAYVTGPVTVHLGKPVVVNDGLAQGFNPAVNDILIKAVRPASVIFDPSLHYAARITLP